MNEKELTNSIKKSNIPHSRIYKEGNGYFVDDKFIDSKTYNIIGETEIANKIKEIQRKGIEAITDKNLAQEKITIKEITKIYINDVLSKNKSSEDSKNRYVKNLDNFSKYTNKEFITNITYQDGLDYQEYIKQNTTEKNSNNIIGHIKTVFRYAAERDYINKSPLTALENYKVDNKNTDKRNFTIDELKNIFNGSAIKETVVLDTLRFFLYTGMRLDEFMKLKEDSFYEDLNYTWVKISTSKQKEYKFRIVPLHPDIKELGNYKWIEKFKKRFNNNKENIRKKLNREIDKVVSDKEVSLHRLRGNFSSIIDEYLMKISVIDFKHEVGDMLGHSRNEFLSKDDLGVHTLTKHLLGEKLELAQQTYSLSSYASSKILAIRAFDNLSYIFSYQ